MKEALCKISYTVLFGLSEVLGLANLTIFKKKNGDMAASGRVGGELEKDIRELSGVIQIFYILMGCGLKKYIHLSKLYCQGL